MYRQIVNKYVNLLYMDRMAFTLQDFAKAKGLSIPSAKVLASRKTRSGKLLRLRRDLYVTKETWNQLGQKEFFKLANLIQTPSYISFLTALSYYELTTQMTTTIVESANPIRSKAYEVEGMIFRYFYCRKEYFFGFQKEKDFFIAQPEKALLDTLYFVFLKRYALDQSALSLRNIHWRQIEKWIKKYPKRFQKFFKNWRD